MGLFRKKSHTAAPARPATQPSPPKAQKPTKARKPAKQPKPAKQQKPAKRPKGLIRGVVDPADFIALRFEMVDLRARLEASEQSKAIVETRLAALDAGNAMARPPHNSGGDGEVRDRIAELETQLEGLAVPSGPVSPDPTLVARIDALSARVDAQHATQPDQSLSAQVDELMSRFDSVPDPERLVALEERVAAAPDAGRIGEIEALIGDLAAKIAEPQELASRVEVLVERVESGEARARKTAEHLGVIEQRMNAVSTELTNQLCELGRDIDGFGLYTNGNGNGSADGSSNGSRPLSAELLAELQAAQVKLAAEQARYEIAFRQDLATLAEHVRRTKS